MKEVDDACFPSASEFSLASNKEFKRQSNHGSRILLAPELGGMKLGKCEGDVLLKFERHFPIVIFDGELIFDVIFTIGVHVHG